MDHGRHRHHPAGWAEPWQSHLVGGVTYTPASKSKDDQVKAAFVLAPGASYPQDEHRTGILLVDPAANEIVFLDYFPNLSSQADANGSLASVSLRLPACAYPPRCAFILSWMCTRQPKGLSVIRLSLGLGSFSWLISSKTQSPENCCFGRLLLRWVPGTDQIKNFLER